MLFKLPRPICAFDVARRGNIADKETLSAVFPATVLCSLIANRQLKGLTTQRACAVHAGDFVTLCISIKLEFAICSRPYLTIIAGHLEDAKHKTSLFVKRQKALSESEEKQNERPGIQTHCCSLLAGWLKRLPTKNWNVCPAPCARDTFPAAAVRPVGQSEARHQLICCGGKICISASTRATLLISDRFKLFHRA